MLCLQLFAFLLLVGAELTEIQKEIHKQIPFDISECQNLMIDAGSNVGVQVRKLFEPEHYPKAQILDVYKSVFGSVSGDKMCAIGIEPNPYHGHRLDAIEHCYKRLGWRTHFFLLTAVGTQSNDWVEIFVKKPLRHNGNRTIEEPDVGSGIISRERENGGSLKVKTIDIVDILAPVKADAKVYLKMDIEGSEWAVLPHLLSNSILCTDKVNVATLEWHRWATSEFEKKKGHISRSITHQVCNHTSISYLDDETYVRDLVTLPCKK